MSDISYADVDAVMFKKEKKKDMEETLQRERERIILNPPSAHMKSQYLDVGLTRQRCHSGYNVDGSRLKYK